MEYRFLDNIQNKTGQFWLDSAPDIKFNGSIIFQQQIKLFTDSSNFQDLPKSGTLYGKLIDGKLITITEIRQIYPSQIGNTCGMMYVFQEVFLGDHISSDYKIQKLYCFTNNLEQWLYYIAHEKIDINDDTPRQIVTQISDPIKIHAGDEYIIKIDFQISPDSKQEHIYTLKIAPYISIECSHQLLPHELLDKLLHIEKLFTLFYFDNLVYFYDAEFTNSSSNNRKIKYWSPKLHKFTQNEKIIGLPLIQRGHLIDYLNPDSEKINKIFSEWVNLDSKELRYIINAIDVVTSANNTHRSKLLEIIFMPEILADLFYEIKTTGNKKCSSSATNNCYTCDETKGHNLKCTLSQLAYKLPDKIVALLDIENLISDTKKLRDNLAHGKLKDLFADFSNINKTESIILFVKTLLIFLIFKRINFDDEMLVSRFKEHISFKSICRK